jgi:hypothetical protein
MALTQIEPYSLDSSNSFTVTNLTTTGNITTTGNLTVTGNITTSGTISGTIGTLTNTTLAGITTLSQTTEIIAPAKTGATGTVTHDLSTGTTFYHSSISANFTAALTNVPTTTNRSIVVVMILIQGSTAYYPNGMTINGTPVTINWVNAAAPSVTASRKEIVSFSLINMTSTWTVVGSLSSFG